MRKVELIFRPDGFIDFNGGGTIKTFCDLQEFTDSIRDVLGVSVPFGEEYPEIKVGIEVLENVPV